MADSSITKKALATALKDLIKDIPLSKITVSDICDKCEMNRKSFYYHFRDKYDLVNWIYYTEFICISNQKKYSDSFSFLLDVCIYLEKNRSFYCKLFSYDGQNSFIEYFKEFLVPIIEKNISDTFEDSENADFYVSFFADTFVTAIKNWLLDPKAVSADKFVLLVRSCLHEPAKKQQS